MPKDKYKEHIKKRQEEIIKFKNDLFEKYDVTDNPKKEKCYQLAYEFGHSYGTYMVEQYFEELVELIKEE